MYLVESYVLKYVVYFSNDVKIHIFTYLGALQNIFMMCLLKQNL